MHNLRELLETHRLRKEFPNAAIRVWDNCLTEDERICLGDVDSAYRQLGTVGFYAEAKGISLDRATIELARQFGMPDIDYFELLRAIAPDEVLLKNVPEGRPVWDRKSCTLSLNGREIRKITSPQRAKNIVAILDKFELEKWPCRIELPIPIRGDIEKSGQAMQSLNRNLKEIHFERDGTGKGARWRLNAPQPRSTS